MEDSNRFDNFLAQLRSKKNQITIKNALLQKNIESEDSLRDSVHGSTKAEVIALFKDELELDGLTASALAGLFFMPEGTSISPLILLLCEINILLFLYFVQINISYCYLLSSSFKSTSSIYM